MRYGFIRFIHHPAGFRQVLPAERTNCTMPLQSAVKGNYILDLTRVFADNDGVTVEVASYRSFYGYRLWTQLFIPAKNPLRKAARIQQMLDIESRRQDIAWERRNNY